MGNSERTVFTFLKVARNKSIRESAKAAAAGDTALKVEWQRRKSFVEKLREDFERWQEGGIPPKVVFISYSKSSGGAALPGEYIYEELEESLRQNGFEVVTGFKRAEGDQGEVLNRVLHQLRRATVFVGIFTKAIQTIDSAGKTMWAPGVWLMEEKGMALALRKTYVWMIEEGIDFNYWFKTTPTKVYVIFNSSNIRDKVKEVVTEVENRYNEALEQFIRERDAKGSPISPEFSGNQ